MTVFTDDYRPWDIPGMILDLLLQEKYRSTYERAHPLTPPKTLKLGGGNLTVLRTMGLAKKGKKGNARDNMYDLYNQNEDSPVSTTGPDEPRSQRIATGVSV